jgi:Fe-S-cluster containining protein
VAAVAQVYADVASAVDARRPRCDISGRCCRFEEHGHRLYVTTIELAAFVAQFTGPANPNWDGTGCPFQRAKLCGVHTIRPFGCRIYFCDHTSTEWQNDAYERFHARIQRLHEELGVPYLYVEWRAALRTLGLANPDPDARV